MTRYDKRLRALAVCLSALAGYVDAIGFMLSGGYFVSFMSGNSTRFGVGAATASVQMATAAGLVASFVAGVALGTMIGHAARAKRTAAVLVAVGLLLTLGTVALTFGAMPLAFAALALAMGAENAVFEQERQVRIGLTYMTGSLVKVGQGLAHMILGQRGWAWTAYLLLWGGFVAGAVLGACAYTTIGIPALWAATIACFGFAGAAWFLPRHDG